MRSFLRGSIPSLIFAYPARVTLARLVVAACTTEDARGFPVFNEDPAARLIRVYPIAANLSC